MSDQYQGAHLSAVTDHSDQGARIAESDQQFGALPMPKAVIFDLDGTLVDTARDFVRIVVEMCDEAMIAPPSDAQIRHEVSSGAAAMVRLFAGQINLPINQSGIKTAAASSALDKAALEADIDAKVEALRDEFVRRYSAQICVDSVVYPGGDQLLEALKAQGVKLGIVTNKPKFLTEKLGAALKLDQHFASILSPEDVSRPKPDPEALFLAAKQLGVPPEQCWYVGDHERDIEAGRRAGMTTVIARYGYIDADADQNLMAQWQADLQVQSLSELSQLLGLS